MSDPTIQVRHGDISTYEGASDDFLTKRKSDLRGEIRNPRLSAGEFLQGVVTQAAISGALLAYSSWMALDKLLPVLGESDFARSIGFKLQRHVFNAEGEKRVRTFAYEIGEYRRDFATSGETWAEYHYSPANAKKTEAFIEDELRMMGRHRFTAGKKGLQDFLDVTLRGPEAEKMHAECRSAAEDELRKAAGTAEEAIAIDPAEIEKLAATKWEQWKRGELMKYLEGVSRDHPDAHLSRLFRLLSKVDEKHGEHPTPVRLIESLVTYVEEVSRDLHENNHKILARYQLPIVGSAVAAAVALTGWRAYRTTMREKMLSGETEISHIERLESERDQNKANAQQASHAIG